MGLFDLFTGKRNPESAKKKTEREIARFARLVGEKMSENFDRQEAIEQLEKYLSDLGRIMIPGFIQRAILKYLTGNLFR